VISGNFAYGIPFIGNTVSYNRVTGNFIGTNAAGTDSIPNTYGVLFDDGSCYNIVGTTNVGERNIISGNTGYGVFIYNYGTHDNIVEGNYIGTDVTGTLAVPNANGIVVDGAPSYHYIRHNVISGNTQEGIVIHITGSDHHVITNNFIGTDWTGVNPLGNGTDGVRIGEGPINNIIGGSAGERNIIAFNHGCGVNILTDDIRRNTISCNDIFGNAELGIDLYPAGPNMNDAGDADGGANDAMNYPVIDSIYFITGAAVLYGHLDTQLPQFCTVELFRADPDYTGYGEGAFYLGSTTPQSNGEWRDTVQNVFAMDFVTATATDSAGNTSEFAFCYPYPPVLIREWEGSALRVHAWPNPAKDVLHLEIHNATETPVGLQYLIRDNEGKIIDRASITQSRIDVIVTDLAPGLYFCEIRSATTPAFIIKFIKP
jgi:titin